jgi:iron complex transport system substrate-binding protein
LAWVGVVAGVALAGGGCERSAAPEPGESSESRDVAAKSDECRIVSFSPAMTRALVDLGLGEAIVARSPYCTAVDESVPALGDLYSVDLEGLLRIEPTHIVIQPPVSGVDQAVLDLAEAHGWVVYQKRLNTVDDIAAMTRDLGGLFDDFDEGVAARAGEVLDRIEALQRGRARPVDGPRAVLLMYSVDPPAVFGQETYLGDVLDSLGYINAAPGSGWLTLTLEDLVRLDPPLIVYVGGAPGAGDAPISQLSELPLRAVRDGRVGYFEHPEALIPSTSVIEVAANLADMLEGMCERKAPTP